MDFIEYLIVLFILPKEHHISLMNSVIFMIFSRNQSAGITDYVRDMIINVLVQSLM